MQTTLYWSLGLSAAMVAAGLVTYWLAPKVGPNPWFGARTGYSVASREVWDATNRATGLGFAACGLVEALLGAALGFLSLDAQTAWGILFGWMIVGLLGVSGWSVLYSRRLAKGTKVQRELRPVAFRWSYVAPVLVSFGALLAYALYLYPQLPATHLATHFDMAGKANGWMDRNEFFIFFLGLTLLLSLLDVGAVLLATREPLIAIDRLGTSWWMTPERGLILLGVLMTVMNVVFVIVLWDTAAFNIQGAHALPMEMFFWIMAPIVLVAVGGFFALAQKSKPEESSNQLHRKGEQNG